MADRHCGSVIGVRGFEVKGLHEAVGGGEPGLLLSELPRAFYDTPDDSALALSED